MGVDASGCLLLVAISACFSLDLDGIFAVCVVFHKALVDQPLSSLRKINKLLQTLELRRLT